MIPPTWQIFPIEKKIFRISDFYSLWTIFYSVSYTFYYQVKNIIEQSWLKYFESPLFGKKSSKIFSSSKLFIAIYTCMVCVCINDKCLIISQWNISDCMSIQTVRSFSVKVFLHLLLIPLHWHMPIYLSW